MRGKWYLFGCLTSVVLVILFIVISISSVIKLAKKPTSAIKIANDSVLHLNLRGAIQEYSEVSDMNFKFIPESAHDIIQKINTAADDQRIKAILLEPQSVVTSRATLNEIMYALKDFKETGKKVYGYITFATQSDIYLLGAADEVYMNPSASAGFVLTGTGGTVEYYKDLLDKIGVSMRVVRAGEYKSAGENFTRSSMSPEFRRNLTDLYSDIYARSLNDFARNFQSSQEKFRYAFERRQEYIINLDKGIELGVVKELLFFDKMLKNLNISEDQLVKLSNYRAEPPREHLNKIAVIYAQGNITPVPAQMGSSNITSKQYVRILEKIENDDNIKAVVLRINSPGGSALESEIIYNKISQVKIKKPIIVSMGGVAASGGYYLAANANRIFADPYTITGSIGVVSMIPDLRNAADKIGINTETVGHGKFLNMSDLKGYWNRDLERGLEIMTNDVYDEFKNRVARGREMSLNDVERVAQGQVWSATKALQHNLVDEIGGLNDAIKKAAEIASIGRYSMLYFPERRNMFETLLEEHFNFSLVKMIIRNELPEFISKPVDKSLEFLNDIEAHPIQMRSELILEFE